MSLTPDWAATIRAIEAIEIADGSVGEVIGAWIDGGATFERFIEPALAGVTLGAIEAENADGTERHLLAVPARVNALAAALGETYWQVLAKAPPKIVVSRTTRHIIGSVRYDVALIDVDAWRAWALENRGAEDLTVEELEELAGRLDDVLDRRDAVAADLKALKAEVKSRGFSPKVLVDVVQMRRKGEGSEEFFTYADMMRLYLERLGTAK